MALTTAEFIAKAEMVHNDMWDYSEVEYINTNTLVKICCPQHGMFLQTPKDHLRGGHKCVECKQKMRHVEFINAVDRLYDFKYDYSNVVFVNLTTPIQVICPIHGSFSILPETHLRRNSSCSKCKQLDAEKIIKRAQATHGDKYDYGKVKYASNREKIEIVCKKHGSFWQNIYGHLGGQGCRQCDNHRKKTTKTYTTNQFIEQATALHGNKYDYSLVEYVDAHSKVTIVCPQHGEFYQSPNNHSSRGTGCPTCGCTGRYDYNRLSTDIDLGNQPSSLYLVKLSSDVESFYKVGVTVNLDNRFKGFNAYNVDIINVVDLKLMHAYIVEQNIITNHTTYVPHNYFGGHTECLSLDKEEVDLLIQLMTSMHDNMEFVLL